MRTGVLLLLLYAAPILEAIEAFKYEVLRVGTVKKERGLLEIGESGVTYQSDNGKTTIQLPFSDLRGADVSDPKKIRLETYDVLKRRFTGRRVYTFRLREDGHDQRLARFLAERLARPVVGHYSTSDSPPFQIAAYHRHRLGGCNGEVMIDADAIQFLSDKPEDSRTWLYRDVESVGSADPFHLRVSTFAETYTFDLKARLPPEMYEFAWRKVNRIGTIGEETRSKPEASSGSQPGARSGFR